MDNDKLKALEAALNKIEKDFGKGAVMKLGDKAIEKPPVIPTGILTLDAALGVGGIPRGRIIEIFGSESSGKTTVAFHMIAEAQKLGGIAAFIDAEHAMDPVYAKAIGVDVDNLFVSQPDNGEAALEIAETLVRSGAVDIIVIDSVAALTPKAEIEGDMGDSFMGLQARLMSQALRKLTAIVNKSKTALVFINQTRQKIGVSYGNPETTTGGNALKFYASVRIDIRKIAAIKEGEDVIGNRTKVKIVKSKVAPPFKQVEFDILYNEGISKTGDLIDLGTEIGVIKKGGAWFTFGEDRIQGREQFKQKLIEYPELYKKLEQEIKLKLGLIKNPPAVEEATEEKTKSKKSSK